MPAGEYLHRMALELADAEADADYARAEGRLNEAATAMAKAKLADERLKRAAIRYGSEEAKRQHGEDVKRGMAAAKAEGRLPGPPRTLDYEAAAHAVKSEGSIKAAAYALKVSTKTVSRALARGRTGSQVISSHDSMHALSRPPPSGDSEE